MKNKLEEIANSIREVGRAIKRDGVRIIVATILPFIFTNSVDAGNLRVYNRSDKVTYNSVDLKHILGAQEGDDIYDVPYISGNPSILHIYSNNPLCNPDKLRLDARGINSTTTFNLELYNKKFPGTANNYLRFRIVDNNDFEWKNIFLGGANDSNNIVADVKYLVVNGSSGIGTYNLPDVAGNLARVYDKRKVIPRNFADLNRNGKVDNCDYAILSGNFGRTGIAKGSDVNDVNDYADMTDVYDVNGVMTSYGDGIVDYKDLGIFVDEYLWDVNDANSW